MYNSLAVILAMYPRSVYHPDVRSLKSVFFPSSTLRKKLCDDADAQVHRQRQSWPALDNDHNFTKIQVIGVNSYAFEGHINSEIQILARQC